MLAPGIWNHICIAYDTHNNHTVKVYMNGKLLLNKSDPRLLGNKEFRSDFLESMTLGLNPTKTSPIQACFRGEMADVGMWSRPLGQEEILNYMSDCVMPEDPDVLNWNTDQV